MYINTNSITKVKHLILILLFVFFTFFHKAQTNWEPLTCVKPSRAIRTLLFDSINNQLIISFERDKNICNSSFKGFLAYNGTNFYDLDFGIETHFPLSDYPSGLGALACIPYKGKTLIGGLFSSAGTNTVQSEAMIYWNSNKYEAFTPPPFKYNASGLTLPNVVYGFLRDGNRLWVYGQFDTIAGNPAQNLAYFDGINYTVVNIPVNDNSLVRTAIKYKDEIYFGGGFSNNPFDSLYYIIRYKNGVWKPVGNGIRTTFGGIYDMTVYNDTLYIAGSFSALDGNAGNNLVKWDGKKYYNSGFDTRYNSGYISKLLTYKNRLYAFGTFYTPTGKNFGAAFYQNGKWTVNTDSFNQIIGGAALYNNEIYISGAFTAINGDSSFNRIAKLKCPDFDYCETKPYIPIEPFLPQGISINGDGKNDELIITLPNTKNATLQIFNRWGSQVFKTNETNLNENSPLILKWNGTYKNQQLPSGTYFYLVEAFDYNNQQKVYKQFVYIVY